MRDQTVTGTAAAVDTAEDVLRVLRDECGLPAWVAFGSLLVVRERTLQIRLR